MFLYLIILLLFQNILNNNSTINLKFFLYKLSHKKIREYLKSNFENKKNYYKEILNINLFIIILNKNKKYKFRIVNENKKLYLPNYKNELIKKNSRYEKI